MSESPPTSSEAHPSEIKLARWTERFIAWLIDFVIVSISLAVLFVILDYSFLDLLCNSRRGGREVQWVTALPLPNFKFSILSVLDLFRIYNRSIYRKKGNEFKNN